jgi:hypothetical protein
MVSKLEAGLVQKDSFVAPAEDSPTLDRISIKSLAKKRRRNANRRRVERIK